MSEDHLEYHPADPVASINPFPVLRELRETCPVSRREVGQYPPMTLVTKYEEGTKVLRDYRTFRNIGVALRVADAEAVPPEQRIHIEMNPPAHTDVRRLLLAAVAPPVIRRALPRLESFGREIVTAFSSRGSADLVTDWAARYPAAAIAAVLGLPDADADMIHRWVDDDLEASVLAAEAEGGSLTSGTSTRSWASDYLSEQFRLRRSGEVSVDDGISRMLAYEAPSGRTFSDDELTVHIHSLLVAGNETTTSMMSNLMYRVLSTAGLFERVRDDRSLIPSLIEESLRYEPPIQALTRGCSRETEIGGLSVAEDDVVCVSVSSANRDAEVWGDDAEEFRPDRFVDTPDQEHLAFGLGVHYCPGAYLARVSGEIAINALFDSTQNMRLAPTFEYEKIYFYLLRRPMSLPVDFDPVT